MNAEKLIPKIIAVLIATVALGAAAQLSIKLSNAVAPITGQSLVVLLIAHLLKEKWGVICILLYLLVGAIGFPVFSDFYSGLEVLTGPSIGYFSGFLVATYAVGKMSSKQPKKFPNHFLQLFIGSILILLCGGIGLFWFIPADQIFVQGILPFLPGALIKVLVGAVLLSVYHKARLILSHD